MTFASRSVTWLRRRPDAAVTILFAALAYLPMLWTRPGRVSADTKTYLTLDPGDVLSNAATMWDPSVGAGTVPHQNIGYLFPLGPYYWVMERLAVPDWITQRLLWATMVYAAAVGTYRLLRWLGWEVAAATVAATFYAFSPYLLSYLARLSVILGPWAAMPWMILLAARAARSGRWRPAAAFALVVALVGSVNATALVLVGIAPVLWLLADVASGRVPWRAALAATARIGVLTLGVSAFWIAGLSVQGGYGLPILRYTETYQAVASASTPNEILRSLGYWFFYGGDRLDSWVGPSPPYINDPLLMVLGFVIAGGCLLGLLVPGRFAGRVNAALFLLVGLTISVGAAPLGDSTIYGSWFERFATDTTVGQALRSTPRAAPLVVFALAIGAGAGVEWATRWWERRRAAPRTNRGRTVITVAAIGAIAIQLFPWFTGRALTPSLLRDEALPAYETELAGWLDGNGTGRVYELPGADFAHYRWGGTVDPVLPGIIERPYLARELVPQGGDGTADLLNAFERRLAEGWFEPDSLLAVAALFDVETIVTRNDLEHERFRLARPGPLWTDVTSVLGVPDHAGPATEDVTAIPLVDELTLARPDAAAVFPAVAAFDVGEPPEVELAPATSPQIVAGSGDGLVDLAGVDLLDPARPVLYSATLQQLAERGDLDPAMFGDDPWWVVTDTNRKQGRHWSTIGSNLGALEPAGPLVLDDDPGDARLDVFGDRVDDQTVAVHRADVESVRASYYGNRIAYTPEDAPHFAIDGDPATAWRAGVFDETVGLVWTAELAEPVDPGELTILQPVTGATSRFITRARVTLDDRSFDVELDERSRAVPGQTIELPSGAFTTITVEVRADNLGERGSYAGLPGVGFAEVTIPGVGDDRVVRMPDLADTSFGERIDADHRLTYVMTRQRIDPATPNRTAPEPAIVRELAVGGDRLFSLRGEVRLASDAAEETLADVLGERTVVVADRRLPGSPGSRGASAFDGDVSTAWQTPFDDVVGASVTIDHGGVVETDAITVRWLEDDQHSSPAVITITADGGAAREFAITPDRVERSVATTTLDVAGYRAATTTVTVTATTDRTSPEYFSGVPQVLPLGIAEIELAGVAPVDGPQAVESPCRSDLLAIDGEPVPVRVISDRAHALARSELTLAGCEPVALGPGTHVVRATAGAATGFDLDRIVLDAPAAGAAPRPAPGVEVDRLGATGFDVDVPPTPDGAWLVLNQSLNQGWRATIDGTDLGPPVLVDGYANAWLLPPADEPRSVDLTWTPQTRVRVGVWVSLATGVVVLALLAWPARRRREESDAVAGVDDVPAADGTEPLVDRRSLPVAVALLLVALVVGGPLAALVVVIAVVLGSRWRRVAPWVVLAAGAVASVPVVVLERVNDYADGPDWPSRFAWTTPFAWVAVVAVVVTVVVPGPVRLPRRARTHGDRRAAPDDG